MGKGETPRTSPQEPNPSAPKGLPDRDTVARVGGSAATAATLGAGIAAGAVVASRAPVDPSAFDHILVTDKPINEIAILFQHNAGNTPGTGSLPVFGENQTMSVGEILDKTPVRGFEVDLHTYQGETVINHGGLFNPLVDEHPTVEDAITPISDWLNKPENNDEVVYVMLESYVGNDGTEDVLNQMKDVFGDKLYTPTDHRAFFDANGRWPTVEELTGEGSRVILMGNNTGTTAGTAFHNQFIFRDFSHTWEDRSGLALLGEEVCSEIVPEIDVDKMDELVAQGGIIKMDQVSPNDPRFFKPEDRGDLAALPDITVGDTFYVSDETLESLMFGFGVASAVGAATFGIVGSVLEAITHETIIQNAGLTLRSRVANCEFTDILSQRAKSDDSPDTLISGREIVQSCRKKMVKDITWSTVKAGTQGTLSIAGSFFGLALLFPPAFPILSALGIGTLVAGAIGTTVATIMNRRRLVANLDNAETWGSVKEEVARKEDSIQKELQNSDSEFFSEKLSAKKQSNRLNQVSRVLLANVLLVRVSSMGKYGVQLIGRISWIATGALVFITSVVEAITNYKARQGKLEDIGKTTSAAVLPALDRRPFLFFGKTPFEKWVVANKEAVLKKVGLGEDATLKQVLAALNEHKDETILKAFREQATMESLQAALSKYAKSATPGSVGAGGSEAEVRELLEEYCIKQVGRAARKDTFGSGVANTLKIGAVVAGIGFLFPPVTGFFVIGAAVFVPLGLVVSRLVAGREERKFKKAIRESMETQRQSKPRSTAKERMHEEYAGKFQGFLAWLSKGVHNVEDRKTTLFKVEEAPFTNDSAVDKPVARAPKVSVMPKPPK